MYHGVADAPDDPNTLFVSPAGSPSQMAWLTAAGCAASRSARSWPHAGGPPARGLVGITFDDGYISVLDTAVPELARYGFGATGLRHLRPPRRHQRHGTRARPGRCCRPQGVGELAAAGIEIGSHSRHAHAPGRVGPEHLAAEVQRQPGQPGRAARHRDPRVRLPLRDDGRGGPAGGPRGGLRHACAVEASKAEIGFMALPRIYVGQRTTRRGWPPNGCSTGAV